MTFFGRWKKAEKQSIPEMDKLTVNLNIILFAFLTNTLKEKSTNLFNMIF